jgi:hypothetical protein
MNKYNVMGITVILVLIIILIAHTVTPMDKDKVFENQFIKFNYSSDFTIVDESNDTSLAAVVYYGDPKNKIVIGTIFSNEANKTMEKNSLKRAINNHDTKEITINGYDTLVEKHQGDPGVEVYINDTRALFILLNPDQTSNVDTIADTLVIKNTPTDVTSDKFFQEIKS